MLRSSELHSGHNEDVVAGFDKNKVLTGTPALLKYIMTSIGFHALMESLKKSHECLSVLLTISHITFKLG